MSGQRRSIVIGAAVTVLAAVGVVVATQSDSDRSAAAPRPSASSGPPQRVILPGSPGDTAVVSDSDQVKAPDGSVYNTLDTTFVQMMIAHHNQALEMARLAPGRAQSRQLRAFADRIQAAQASEIAWMQGWLK